VPLSNWYPDQNRFALTAPSPWWLHLLREYDDQLVVLPSRVELLYRLTRRVRPQARLGLQAMIVHEHPDTVMMIQYGVIPVSSLTTWAIQSDKVIRDLMARDTWRVLGKPVLDAQDAQRAADLTIARLDAQEAATRQADERRAQDMVDAAGSDAFHSLQHRKGERIVMSDVHRGYGAPHAQRSGWKTIAKASNNSVISPVTSSRPAPSPFLSIVLTDR
jgi:hypothetical protein